MLNGTNMYWLSMITRSMYRHFSVATGEYGYGGFGSDIDQKFFRKLDLQIRLTQLKAGYPTMDDPWTTEDQRQEKIKKFSAIYASEFANEAFEPNLPELYQKLIKTDDDSRGIYFLSGTKLQGSIATKGSTQAYYLEHKDNDMVVIVFRGTEINNTEDLDRILDTKHVPFKTFPNALVMSGFSAAYLEIREGLMGLIQRKKNQKKPINLWVTGHSLGGAIANLFVADVLERKNENDLSHVNLMGLYTFGAPRVGDARFALGLDFYSMYLNVPIYRVRNAADIVTGVPLGFKNYPGYWHGGSLVYLDAKGRAYYGNGWKDIESKSDLLNTLPTSLGDHSLEKYIPKLLAIKNTPQDKELANCQPREGERGFAPYVENPELRDMDWKDFQNIRKKLK